MSIKILVADDSITIQKVIGIIFGGDEYTLTIVDNGKAAIEKARETDPDILLIDALMPGMTGYEVVESVRSTPSLASRPILMLTGSFEPFDEEKAKKCGADDFISKPFESHQIVAKVKELLQLGSSRTEPAHVPPPQADIWSAFTPGDEFSIHETGSPAVAPSFPVQDEPDIFAIITEENNSQLIQTPTPLADSASDHTGSQWIPVEENTFEFVEALVEQGQAAPPEAAIHLHEDSFSDISFDDEVSISAAPVLSSIPDPDFPAPLPAFSGFPEPFPESENVVEFESAPIAEATAPFTTPPPVTLTEEQLKEAIMAASKDVIERIVWEVVPDLAETMIREAIRKIKEGN